MHIASFAGWQLLMVFGLSLSIALTDFAVRRWRFVMARTRLIHPTGKINPAKKEAALQSVPAPAEERKVAASVVPSPEAVLPLARLMALPQPKPRDNAPAGK